MIYDSNQISIEDDTNIAFTEDVADALRGLRLARADASTGRRPASTSRTSQELYAALEAAKGETDKPSLIILRTIIGWPVARASRTPARSTARRSAPTSSPRPRRSSASTPSRPSTSPTTSSPTPAAVGRARRGRARRVAGAASTPGPPANPERKALLRPRARPRELPEGIDAALPGRSRPARTSPPAPRPARSSTRSPPSCPSCGAAPPTSPSRTTPRSRARSRSSPRSGPRTSGPATRTAGCCTSASASTRWARSSTASCCTARPAPFGGTFLIFSDYMRPRGPPRRADEHPVDLRVDARLDRASARTARPTSRSSSSPTLRAIPNFDVVRPGDANETAVAWLEMLRRHRAAPPASP